MFCVWRRKLSGTWKRSVLIHYPGHWPRFTGNQITMKWVFASATTTSIEVVVYLPGFHFYPRISRCSTLALTKTGDGQWSTYSTRPSRRHYFHQKLGSVTVQFFKSLTCRICTRCSSDAEVKRCNSRSCFHGNIDPRDDKNSIILFQFWPCKLPPQQTSSQKFQTKIKLMS